MLATPNEELFFKGNQDVPATYVADIHGMRLLTTTRRTKIGVEHWFIKRLLGGQELNAAASTASRSALFYGTHSSRRRT